MCDTKAVGGGEDVESMLRVIMRRLDELRQLFPGRAIQSPQASELSDVSQASRAGGRFLPR